jgi:tetratricopeptide (TPR) repeat protein
MGITKAKTAYELAHEVAQRKATKMLGLPKGNTAMDRAKAMGYDTPGYHATPEDWISRALAHLPKDPDLALQDLRSAESLDPGRADVLQNMAHVLHDYQQDVQGAVSCLTKILESTPQNEMARVDRAVLFGVLGDQAKATSDIAWLLQTEARLDPSTFYQIGCVYAQLSRNAKQNRPDAIRYLTRAVFQGYGKELLSTDSHLDPIRDDPQFQSLVVLCSVANGEAPME